MGMLHTPASPGCCGKPYLYIVFPPMPSLELCSLLVLRFGILNTICSLPRETCTPICLTSYAHLPSSDSTVLDAIAGNLAETSSKTCVALVRSQVPDVGELGR